MVRFMREQSVITRGNTKLSNNIINNTPNQREMIEWYPRGNRQCQYWNDKNHKNVEILKMLVIHDDRAMD